MNIATQNTRNNLNSLRSTEVEGNSFQKALFSLWMDLEKNLETLAKPEFTTAADGTEDLSQLDDIIDAQDLVANAAFHSRAETYEDLLYKLAMWRSDTPDFETRPIQADRKDRIVYSVFKDLVKITGMDHVQSTVDKTADS